MEFKWIGTCKKSECLGISERRIRFDEKGKSISITIRRIGTEEAITIQGEIDEHYAIKILFSLLRLDNLFDGFFIKPKRIIIDGKNCPRYLNNWLPFYKSSLKLDSLRYQNDNWSDVFERWQELDEKLGIIHNMFLYASYAEDLTPDVKMALILQTFEPLADDLSERKLISLEKRTKKYTCENCGYENERKVKNTLFDKLKSIMNTYGKYIFVKEDCCKVAEIAKNTRNKIVHLDREKKAIFTGEQSGCYYYKFNMLYRNIILNLLGVASMEIDKQIERKSLSWKDEMIILR